MCFSATASFTIASLLSLAGIATLKSLPSKKYLCFAAIPLFFGIQQFCEGFVWLGLTYGWSFFWTKFFSYSFLFFAYIMWPCWIPLSLCFLEANDNKRKIFVALTVIGILLGLYLAQTVYDSGVLPAIVEHHIKYGTDDYVGLKAYICGSLYALTTIVPFFIATGYLLNILGIVLLLSAGISFYLWQVTFTSTWCFFSALLSAAIYFLVQQDYAKKQNK